MKPSSPLLSSFLVMMMLLLILMVKVAPSSQDLVTASGEYETFISDMTDFTEVSSCNKFCLQYLVQI